MDVLFGDKAKHPPQVRMQLSRLRVGLVVLPTP